MTSRMLGSAALPSANGRAGSGKEDSHTRPEALTQRYRNTCLVASFDAMRFLGRPRIPRCEGGGSPNEEAVSVGFCTARRPDDRSAGGRFGPRHRGGDVADAGIPALRLQDVPAAFERRQRPGHGLDRAYSRWDLAPEGQERRPPRESVDSDRWLRTLPHRPRRLSPRRRPWDPLQRDLGLRSLR